MELTEGQKRGLDIAVARYKARKPYTVIAGYAGTGKTSLIKEIVAELGLRNSEVAYAAYTGKAAKVLKNKGCEDAMTTHRLLYDCLTRDDGTPIFRAKRNIGNYKLIVVDEVSMLPQEMWDLLLSHRIHVIALGDIFQLQPVSGQTTVLDHPHIFLDEITRQEAESEIVQLSMRIRNGEYIEPFKGNTVQVLSMRDLTKGMYLWADQVIAGKNDTRRSINSEMRELIMDADNPEPIVGDKVICLRNNWDIISFHGDALVNGMTGRISNIKIKNFYKLFTYYYRPFFSFNFMLDDGDNFEEIVADYQLLTTGEPTVNRENWKTIPRPFKPNEFDYGYCITCWKAQGDEFNKVLFLAERVGNMGSEEYQKYLYTGVTRAREKLVLIMPY